jgi:hypothetical protein
MVLERRALLGVLALYKQAQKLVSYKTQIIPNNF